MSENTSPSISAVRDLRAASCSLIVAVNQTKAALSCKADSVIHATSSSGLYQKVGSVSIACLALWIRRGLFQQPSTQITIWVSIGLVNRRNAIKLSTSFSPFGAPEVTGRRGLEKSEPLSNASWRQLYSFPTVAMLVRFFRSDMYLFIKQRLRDLTILLIHPV